MASKGKSKRGRGGFHILRVIKQPPGLNGPRRGKVYPSAHNI